ncbi:hypothetical protein KAX75_13580 [candidate division WOR-3 bacterium]|nr:hypothetical protein [candidate division WOR-3 bacterium]
MSIPFWVIERERTQFSDNTFSMVGRALTVATEFESNIRNLSSILSLKLQVRSNEFILNDKEYLNKFISKIQKKPLGIQVEKINKKLDFPFDLFKLIYEAKETRNDIVHELTLGIEHNIETDEGRKFIVETLTEKISKIAKANIIIIYIICLETNKEKPTVQYINSYGEMILNWVLHVGE